MKKQYVGYDPDTFIFLGFYKEDRRDLPDTIAEVNSKTFLEDKGQHTHYSPVKGFYTDTHMAAEELIKLNRSWRNSILRNTDKYLFIDFPITPQDLKLIITYRQQLRKYPENWIRPSPPSFL